jgi:hypothetical protein
MTTNRLSQLAVALVSAALAASCGDSVDSNVMIAFAPPAYGPGGNILFTPPDYTGNGGITGDWWQCEDVKCAELDSTGIRFTADGQFVILDSRGDLEPDETYCEDYDEGVGRFEYDDTGALTVTEPNGKVTETRFIINGNIAFLVVESQTVSIPFARIDPIRSTGPCRNEVLNGGDPAPDAPPTRGG